MRISLLNRLAVSFLAASLIGGCASEQEHPRSEQEIKADQLADENSLDWFFSKLTPDQIAEMNKLRDQLTDPISSPFQDGRERETYTIWYKTGYAYGLMTGIRVERDWVWRDDRHGVDRAKMEGWFAGTSAGGEVRQSKDIESALDAALDRALMEEGDKPQTPTPAGHP